MAEAALQRTEIQRANQGVKIHNIMFGFEFGQEEIQRPHFANRPSKRATDCSPSSPDTRTYASTHTRTQSIKIEENTTKQSQQLPEKRDKKRWFEINCIQIRASHIKRRGTLENPSLLVSFPSPFLSLMRKRRYKERKESKRGERINPTTKKTSKKEVLIPFKDP